MTHCDCGSCCAWAEVLEAIDPIIQSDLLRAYNERYAPTPEQYMARVPFTPDARSASR